MKITRKEYKRFLEERMDDKMRMERMQREYFESLREVDKGHNQEMEKLHEEICELRMKLEELKMNKSKKTNMDDVCKEPLPMDGWL